MCMSELMMGVVIGVLILPPATARAGELGSAPPWENVNLPGFVHVDQPGATAAASASIGAPAAPSGARSNASTDIELAFWRPVRTSGKAEEYSTAPATAPAPSDMSSDGGARARRASIGVATMKDDGTIVLDLVAVNGAGVTGDARLVYSPGHSRYREVLEHVSGLRPGEHKPVPPWPDCDPLAGVPELNSYWNVKVPGKYWIDMAWNDNEWEPAEPIPMPLHHATRLELTNLSAFPSLVSHRGRRIRFTVEITARDITSSGGARPEWRATYRARAIDTCILE